MGDARGFLKTARQNGEYRPVCERVQDFNPVFKLRLEKQSQEQASRCMDCATPFCHWGCPVGNYIPEWNDYMFRGHWEKAFEMLQLSNNFPEFTGRICPATCEYACVLGINDDPVTIRENELAIIEHAFKHGLVKPRPPEKRTGKRVAIIGSGPAGLACADQLNKAGHEVIIFEKDDKPGGILRYGIPDFKLEKSVIDRRLDILKKEGIVFKTGMNIGIGAVSDRPLHKDFDAVCLACGSRVPRDLNIEGRKLEGIYFAMDYLTKSVDAKGKRVVVIGGGDTGADCVGTAHRQGASCMTQIEVLERPSECRTSASPWPKYPLLLKKTSSHEEGGERHWGVLTKRFIGENGVIKKLSCVKVEFSRPEGAGCTVMKEIPGSAFEIEADFVILAIGFLHPEHSGFLTEMGIEFDKRGNVKTDGDYRTSKENVFSAGDMRRGQSLVVWAIAEGRQAAHHIDKYLMGESSLEK
ncbi:MAG: glutamate synthase subunit beta [Candidatus Omnitrophota bacterium]|nr:glutamate synthase subunit beta [Candidatus Omnitrophota bacterium]